MGWAVELMTQTVKFVVPGGTTYSWVNLVHLPETRSNWVLD